MAASIDELSLLDMGIVAFDEDYKCPKCRHDFIRTWWCDGRTYADCSPRIWYSPTLLADHMHQQCERCEKEWFATPAEADTGLITEELRSTIRVYTEIVEEEHALREGKVLWGRTSGDRAETVDDRGEESSGGLPEPGRRDDLGSVQDPEEVVLLDSLRDAAPGDEGENHPGDDRPGNKQRARRIRTPIASGGESRIDTGEKAPE